MYLLVSPFPKSLLHVVAVIPMGPRPSPLWKMVLGQVGPSYFSYQNNLHEELESVCYYAFPKNKQEGTGRGATRMKAGCTVVKTKIE